ncbi:helix-turn-helix domain-containing protein [Maribellus comscasis]|uniref:Helix-turn-helix domain-containing protein n=1 Tax=Maribellus comscasis TaxID=2681766 RepID=A0A6I6JZ58_9BACT|nr:Crp/Fnr family transcriptional regulator [Maribellus comscasis]QGY42974.1 helix-turn-helix domain-containing protein [Maribellus comscasis]
MNNFNIQYQFLEKELQEEILNVGIQKTFQPNEVLIREGQFITSFPLVLKGLIRITRNNDDGNELLLYYLKDNEVCAMSLTCCMANSTSNVQAITEEETEVIMLPVSLLDSWMCKYPSWKQFVMQTFQNRFRAMIDTVDTLAFLKLDERLVKFFVDRNEKSGLKTFNGTHQDLALQLNTSREVISRLLKKLEKEGKIQLSRNFIDFSGLL